MGLLAKFSPMGIEYRNRVTIIFITRLQNKFPRKKAFNDYIEIAKINGNWPGEAVRWDHTNKLQ